MTSTTDFDHLEIQQQYSRINARWEASDDELDNDNSSARLFERSRIKALAGRCCVGSGRLSFLCWSLTFPPLWGSITFAGSFSFLLIIPFSNSSLRACPIQHESHQTRCFACGPKAYQVLDQSPIFAVPGRLEKH